MPSADAAMVALRGSLRAAANAQPDNLAALAKDMATLAKLLRNPALQPQEAKFRKIKQTNATVARVMANEGVRDVLLAGGFAGGTSDEFLEIVTTNADTVAKLLHAAEAVEAVQNMLQELHWIRAVRSEVSSLAAQPWAVDGAAVLLVQMCLVSLHSPDAEAYGAASWAPWLGRLHLILSTPEMVECQAAVAKHATAAVLAVRRVALHLLGAGALDVNTLVLANKCLALLWPPGDPKTLPGRLEHCFACLEAALPPDDEPMELRLRLKRQELLGSTIEALGAFSEVGVRCGVLKQELTIEYQGEAGQDAGGLLRQFFDLFTGELMDSGLWTQTAAGGLRPADAAAAGAASGGGAAGAARLLRAHMETCGRVCGMALYQELHRRRSGMLQAMLEGGSQPPTLFGAAFARYFIRVIQHSPPSSLAELQAELRAECLETSMDYRSTGEILERSVAESGLQDATFVRAVGDVEIPLVDGGAAIGVTDDNKREWVERLLRCEMVDGYAEAAAHFRKGLVDVVGLVHVDARNAEASRFTTPHFFLLTAEELQLQWSGAPVSRAFIEELREVAEVHAEVRVQAGWLWEVMLAIDDETRAKVFRFVTGSSRRPCDGFSNFRIGPKEGGDGAYPFAHACANALDLPSYSSQAVLRERLEAAVDAAHDKFTDL